jgi:hypothetical protein
MCTAVLIGWDTATRPFLHIWSLDSCTRALLVSKDRRHLFVNPVAVRSQQPTFFLTPCNSHFCLREELFLTCALGIGRISSYIELYYLYHDLFPSNWVRYNSHSFDPFKHFLSPSRPVRPPLLLCVVVSQNRVIKGCGVAQLVVRRLTVRQARVRFSARHPWRFFLCCANWSDEETRRRATANGEEWMIVLIVKKIINFKNSGIMPPNL